MIGTILVLSVVYGVAKGSIEHGAVPLPAFATQLPVPPPVVTSSSSQYFERNFNRLVIPHAVVPVAPAPPVLHIAPAPPAIPVAPVAPAPPPVFVQPTANAPVTPVHNEPLPPNIAIAVATAQAAPVATFLLPPYPFGVPPNFGFIPPTPTNNVPDDSRKETTTPTTKQTFPETTTKEIETTTPLTASNSDNSFVQASPSNQNTNLNSYGLPNTDNSFAQASPTNQNTNFNAYEPPRPQWPQPQPQNPQPQWTQHQKPQWPQQWQQRPRQKPLKLKTTVEVVPVPLAYIAPPPLQKYQAVKTVKHIHTFVPTKAKLIIRPVHVSSPIKIVRSVPAKLVFKLPITARGGPARPVPRETEPVTFRPFSLPVTKPPRL